MLTQLTREARSLFPGSLFLWRRAWDPRVFALLLVFFGSLPAIALLYELMLASVAIVLASISASDSVRWALQLAGFDRVYSSVLTQMAGEIKVHGIAVAGSIGTALYALVPSVFASPDLVPNGAWAGAVVEAGSSLLARFIAQVAAASAIFTIGLALGVYVIRKFINRGGWHNLAQVRFRIATIAFISLAMELRAIGAIIAIPLTMRRLEAMGLAQFVTKVLSSTPQAYANFVNSTEPLVPWVGPIVLLLMMLWISAMNVVLLWVIVRLIRKVLACWPAAAAYRPAVAGEGGIGYGRVNSVGKKDFSAIYPALGIMVAVGFTVNTAGVETNFTYQPASQSVSIKIDGNNIAASPAAGVYDAPVLPLTRSTRLNGQVKGDRKPSVVTIRLTDRGYEYRVNGNVERIHGVGYNVQYNNLPTEERKKRYDRDFQQMQAAGFDTILGWGQNNFDEVTMEKAAEYDIGVVLPYELPTDVNYSDPAVGERIRNDVLAWVAKYKDQPSLRMWGIGNEVLHTINPKQDRAFADFYYHLAEAVHQLDPNHPVLYRDAEDVFVPVLKAAIKKNSPPRPWFVYGTNIFTYRLKQILTDWHKQGLDSPLLVSEFAPTGLPRNDRPTGYMNMWAMLYGDSSAVLGGFMYVWTTEGPEPLDRVYGLVDRDGVPTDSSLKAMSAMFKSEEPGGGG